MNYTIVLHFWLCIDLPRLFSCLVFGLLTIKNIQQTQWRIVPILNATNNGNKKKPQKHDISEASNNLYGFSFFLPVLLQSIYKKLTRNSNMSWEQQQLVHNFLDILFILATLMKTSIPFYILTLTEETLPQELKGLLFSQFRLSKFSMAS